MNITINNKYETDIYQYNRSWNAKCLFENINATKQDKYVKVITVEVLF
jgi:hypothetical protein